MRSSPHVTTLLIVSLLAIALASCQSSHLAATKVHAPQAPNAAAPDQPTQNGSTATQQTGTQQAAAPTRTNVIDPTKIPLGDGNVSTSPKHGSIFSCTQDFRSGGAEHTGSWLSTNSWDETQKIHVQGTVTWPDARFSISEQNGERIVTGDDLPTHGTTGTFPTAASDPAYAYDRNPNAVEPQQLSFSLPLDPTVAKQPSCVPMGMVGVALNGVAIFNGLDDAGRDAVAHEVQDSCDGHPQSGGVYHYHSGSPCIPGINGSAQLVGYALDGFGIYSRYDASGRELTNADLDACHGTTSEVMWNGKLQSVYHYVITREYPYTIGCFRGTPIHVQLGSPASSKQPLPGSPPPRIA